MLVQLDNVPDLVARIGKLMRGSFNNQTITTHLIQASAETLGEFRYPEIPRCQSGSALSRLEIGVRRLSRIAPRSEFPDRGAISD
jgi:hypothetical protein